MNKEEVKMENSEILASNKIIAEFMGYVKTSSDKDFTFYEHPDGKGIVIQSSHDYKKFHTYELMEARGFNFHRSWEWLMLVVEKIRDCRNEESDDTTASTLKGEIYHVVGRGRLELSYKAILKFINWYNRK
jgi:hypothetical protein